MKTVFNYSSFLKAYGVGLFSVVFALTTSVFAANVEPLSLFQSNALRSGNRLYINQEAVDQLRQPTGPITLADVPLITGKRAEFRLSPLPVFAKDAQITLVKRNGETESLPLPKTRTWYGTNADDPDLALFLSANDAGEVRVMVTGDSQSSVTIIAQKDSGGEYGILPATLPNQPICDMQLLPQPQLTQAASVQTDSPTTPGKILEIELMVDVSHSLYNKLNGDPALIANYLLDLFGAVNTIYQRDLHARFTVVSVFAWATTDPFNVNHPKDIGGSGNPNPNLTTYDQIYNYQDYCNDNRSSVSRDLAHLVNYNLYFGGVAFLRVLDDQSVGRRYGVSNVWAINAFPSDPNDINSYYWDTSMAAHELGHNVGSQHTHCYSPPIDCCNTQESCSQCETSKHEPGTIMSYCHLGSNGKGTPMFFHQRCYDEQIGPHLAAAAASNIISPFEDKPVIAVEGTDGILISEDAVEAGPGAKIKAWTVGDEPVIVPFTIKNEGTTDLILTGEPKVSISGSHLLSVTQQPAINVVPPSGRTTFLVQFDSYVEDVHEATITILSNDPAIPVYSFVVQGVFMKPSDPYVFSFNGNVELLDTGVYRGVDFFVTDIPGNVVRELEVSFDGTNCDAAAQTGLEHPDVSELFIHLEAPSGKWIVLLGYLKSTPAGANLCNTRFVNDASAPSIQFIEASGAPHTGRYQPNIPLSDLYGEEANGIWRLSINDQKVNGVTGTLHAVSLHIRGEVEVEKKTAAKDWSLYW